MKGSDLSCRICIIVLRIPNTLSKVKNEYGKGIYC